MDEKKITWEFKKKWFTPHYILDDVLAHENYGIYKNNYEDFYRLIDSHDNVLYKNNSFSRVIQYAEKLIKDPRHKERKELLKTIKELKDKTRELEKKVEGL